MLNEKVSQLLNDQVNKEFYSAYLYLQFSNFYVEQGLAGFANWYKVQAQEERDHAMLMLQYLQNNDVPVTLEAVAKPDAELKANMDPLKAGLAHEQYVTSLIHAIYEAAYESLGNFRFETDFGVDRRCGGLATKRGEQCPNRWYNVS